MRLEGRVIGITGASGNLGLATAKVLLAGGARVIALDRHAAHAKTELAEEIEAGRARAYEVDLLDETAAGAALREGAKTAGRFDGLVCTVGGYKGGVTTIDAPWSDWAAMLDVNVKATVACTRAALPLLLERGGGSIVHVASLASLSGSSGQAAYSAAKAAVLRFTEALADEVKGKGIRVNAVLPGTLDTPQNRSWMPPDQAALAIDPADVGAAIAFLLSDDARAVTGAAIRVTGRQ